MENDSIRIIQIICYEAEEEGKQYTKRLLPSFLIPHCVIRLDTTLQAYKIPEKDKELVEKACELMGCIDERTARRHLAGINLAVGTASLQLAEIIAANPELGSFPEHDPHESSIGRLKTLLKETSFRYLRSGNAALAPNLLQILHSNWESENKKKPSSYVSTYPRPP